MVIKINYLLVIICLITFGCNKKSTFQTDSSGLQYKLIKSENKNAQKVALDDIVELNLTSEKEDGTILFDSKKSDRKYLRKISPASHVGGSFEDGLNLLSEGDSIVFYVNAENYYHYTEKLEVLPENIKFDDKLIFKVKLIDVMDSQERTRVIDNQYHKDTIVENELLSTYLKNANIKIKPTETGLVFFETKQGSGNFPTTNNNIVLNYTVTLLDGTLIETTLDKKPFQFKIGRNQVIKGLEEGILKMKKGGSAMLFIPSKLAYGSVGNSKILPYTTLIFDIELIDIL
ncbi:MAG: FKBP-type peptidyl-prolyl cis-trans isomerase [Bacteroidales bacterium]|jgi:FKBP-type peptidyl-prolyl cis-trans isomerase|nr:FKBP-type peptidyl-prolyl cis-trans isomerase [Bacteroidales bacterium]